MSAYLQHLLDAAVEASGRLNSGPCRFMVYTPAGLQLDLQATVQ